MTVKISVLLVGRSQCQWGKCDCASESDEVASSSAATFHNALANAAAAAFATTSSSKSRTPSGPQLQLKNHPGKILSTMKSTRQTLIFKKVFSELVKNSET